MNTGVERVWEEFRSPLKAYVRKHINNEQDSEDIVQNIFLKIHHNIDQLTEADKLRPWIYRIARNTIYDFYRAQKHDLPIDEVSENLFTEEQEEELLNIEVGSCLVQMLQYLPDKYKQALMLTEIENYTQTDLAKHLGLSVSGAKSRVQRARLKLKEMLLNCCSIELDHRGNVIDYKQKNKCDFC